MGKRIFVSAGDHSADLHASNLVRALKKLDGETIVSSIGGKRLSEAGDELLYDIVGLNVHGYFEPVKQYFKLRDIFYNKVVPHLRDTRPAAVVLSDYYGFNINIAEYAAGSLGIPVYYFISPQVWATRPNRIKRIKRSVRHMLVIFPFEEKIYRDAGIKVTFVGHPLLDSMALGEVHSAPGPEKKGITVGLFPGSRAQVIKWNLPVMEKAADIIRQEIKGAEFEIMGLSELKNSYHTPYKVVYDADYSYRRNITMALSASGTVTLENALLGIPMIVLYKMPFFMYHLIKSMVHVSNISIVNLITQRQVIPEFIQDKADPGKIAGLAAEWLKNPGMMEDIRSEFAKLPALLGQRGAVDRAAKIILEGI